MPNVAAWLRHVRRGAAASVDDGYPDLDDGERVRAIALENVVAQLAHLRTHPSVAAGIARGEIALHGWFVDIHAGQVLGARRRHRPLHAAARRRSRCPSRCRRAAPRRATSIYAQAAE